MKVVKTIYRIIPNGQISSEYVEALFGKTANVKDFDTLLKEHY